MKRSAWLLPLVGSIVGAAACHSNGLGHTEIGTVSSSTGSPTGSSGSSGTTSSGGGSVVSSTGTETTSTSSGGFGGGTTSSAVSGTSSSSAVSGTSSSSAVSGTSSSSGGFDPSHAPSTLGGFTTQGSAGCAMGGVATGARTVSLMVDGEARTGTVFVPAGYNPTLAYPIVFVFHGDGGTGAQIRTALDLEPDAAGKAIFAYPDGDQQTWNATEGGGNSDMDFVMALRESLRGEYCADMNRTFLTGMSRGGFFVNQLACEYGIKEFAAIAPHSSTIDPGNDNAYIYGPPNAKGGPYMEMGNYDFACPSDGTPPPAARPILPPPAFVIHGQCDTEGGVEYPEGRRVAEHWGFAAACTSTPAVAVTTSPDPTCAAPFTTNPMLSVDPCYVAPGCTSGHDITFCAIPGMDHEIWTDAHTRIWSFFASH